MVMTGAWLTLNATVGALPGVINTILGVKSSGVNTGILIGAAIAAALYPLIGQLSQNFGRRPTITVIGILNLVPACALYYVLVAADRTTLTRNLRPLENEGLVSVGPEGWRRSRTVEITKKGQWRLREALPLWERAQDALRQKLGDQAWVDVRHSLDRLIRAVRNTSLEEALLQTNATTKPQIADKKMP